MYMGMLCQHGKGIDQDNKEALKWYREAAEQGNTYAQYAIGVMYQDGKGVDQDYKEAVKWYRKTLEENRDPFARSSQNFRGEGGKK